MDLELQLAAKSEILKEPLSILQVTEAFTEHE
jgi:hypothetical protein